MRNTVFIGGPENANFLYETIVLQPNVINGKNILSQVLMGNPNTKYVIKWDYDLAGERIELQENCLLQFDGGVIRNGTLVGNNTIIISNQENNIILPNVFLEGTFSYTRFTKDLIQEDLDLINSNITNLEQNLNSTNINLQQNVQTINENLTRVQGQVDTTLANLENNIQNSLNQVQQSTQNLINTKLDKVEYNTDKETFALKSELNTKIEQQQYQNDLNQLSFNFETALQQKLDIETYNNEKNTLNLYVEDITIDFNSKKLVSTNTYLKFGQDENLVIPILRIENRPMFTVTFNNLGSNIYTQSVLEGNTITLIIPQNPDTTKQFDGWYTNASYTGTKYNLNSNYTVTQDVTFYAKWVDAGKLWFRGSNDNTLDIESIISQSPDRIITSSPFTESYTYTTKNCYIIMSNQFELTEAKSDQNMPFTQAFRKETSQNYNVYRYDDRAVATPIELIFTINKV